MALDEKQITLGRFPRSSKNELVPRSFVFMVVVFLAKVNSQNITHTLINKYINNSKTKSIDFLFSN